MKIGIIGAMVEEVSELKASLQDTILCNPNSEPVEDIDTEIIELDTSIPFKSVL